MKKEYKVQYVWKDRLWRVIHIHNYPNYSHKHFIYVGNDWKVCMWFATGDLTYFPSNSPYAAGEVINQCGSRLLSYLEHRGLWQRVK